MQAVDEVLEEIGAGEKPRLLVLNKADLLSEEERREVELGHPDAVLVSAREGEGLEELRERIEAAFEETLTEVELLIPYSRGRPPARAARGGRRPGADRARGRRPRPRQGRRSAELHRFGDSAGPATSGLGCPARGAPRRAS